MIVSSDDNTYGIPKDLFFSFPVIIENGKWRIVRGFKMYRFLRDGVSRAVKELEDEKKQAEKICF